MVDRGRGARFPDEPLPERLVPGQFGRQHLDRDRALQPGVVGAVDHGHATPADLLVQPVPPGGIRHRARQMPGLVSHRGPLPTRAELKPRSSSGHSDYLGYFTFPRSMVPAHPPGRTASGASISFVACRPGDHTARPGKCLLQPGWPIRLRVRATGLPRGDDHAVRLHSFRPGRHRFRRPSAERDIERGWRILRGSEAYNRVRSVRNGSWSATGASARAPFSRSWPGASVMRAAT